ncbi:MAG: hypothetical protein FRX49_12049 [Trebouxia sp. A1-2]|nr:MAG: hypothetical protein FRX49_12049 [Trebouxia sp. A1-2]
MAEATQRPPLQELLRKAVRAPDRIHTQDGGAVLALAVHCLFVEAGFTNVDYVRGSPYQPEPEWNRSHDAWIFRYKKTKLTAVGIAAIVALLVWKVKGSQ